MVEVVIRFHALNPTVNRVITGYVAAVQATAVLQHIFWLTVFGSFPAVFDAYNLCFWHENNLLTCLIRLGMVSHILEALKVVFGLHKRLCSLVDCPGTVAAVTWVKPCFWVCFCAFFHMSRCILMSNMISMCCAFVLNPLHQVSEPKNHQVHVMCSLQHTCCNGAFCCWFAAVLASFFCDFYWCSSVYECASMCIIFS